MIGWRKKSEHRGAISLDGHAGLSDDYLELARFWISPERGRSYVLTARMDQWSPDLLGALLVESAHTAAVGYAAQTGMTKEEALLRIWRGFDDERARLGSDSPKEKH